MNGRSPKGNALDQMYVEVIVPTFRRIEEEITKIEKSCCYFDKRLTESVSAVFTAYLLELNLTYDSRLGSHLEAFLQAVDSFKRDMETIKRVFMTLKVSLISEMGKKMDEYDAAYFKQRSQQQLNERVATLEARVSALSQDKNQTPSPSFLRKI